LVYGSLYDQKSWSKVANIIAAMGTSTYRYHSTVQFGLMGNAEEYQGVGWSVPSDNCEWNDGLACSMIFFLEDTCSDILLKATFIPYLPKGIIDKQRVNILERRDRKASE
jgi:hypothetical protein